MEYRIFDDMTQCTQQEVNSLLMRVPAFRGEQALKFKHLFGQFCCLKSYVMLADLLSTQSAATTYPTSFNFPLSTFHYNEFGKPVVPGAPEFSISHCKQAIAVAINDTPIGIDVESIREVDDALIARTMNQEEQALIRAAADKNRAFTRLWTMKEAYLKYLGTGIIDDLTTALSTANPAQFTVEERGSYVLSIYC